MYNLANKVFGSKTKTQKIEILLFLFIIIVFTIISLYTSSIVSKSQINSQFNYPIVNFSDSASYAMLGQNLISNHIYSQSEYAPYAPEINWAPGYPILIGISLKFFESAVPLAIIQMILAGITGVFMFRIARQFIPTAFAVVPPIIFALDPSIAYYSSAVHTDGLFMAFITIIVYFLFFHIKKKLSLLAYVALGILLGYSSLIRSIGQYLILVLPILLILHATVLKRINKHMYVGLLLFVTSAVLVITPWMMHNKKEFGVYSLGNIGAKTMLLYNVKDFLTVKARGNESQDFAKSQTAEKIGSEIQTQLQELVSYNGGTPESNYQELALKYIFENPVAYTRFHLTGTMPYFLAGSYRHFNVSVLGTFKKQAGLTYPKHENIAHKMTSVLYSGELSETWLAIKSLSFTLIDIAWRMIIVAFGLLAFFIKGRDKKISVLLLWILVSYFAFLTGPASLTRYRIVSEPFLLILAGIGFWNTVTWMQLRLKDVKIFRNKTLDN